MLQKLYIRNYAIIDELTITFDPHLNVITGETGAGKSIILGALSLILGDRADTSVLINRMEKCIIEATFFTESNALLSALLEAEALDNEPHTIIRREISTSGKSRAFVNDTPVKLDILNKISGCLVDLHRQFDNYFLRDRQFMFEVLDAVSDNAGLLKKYRELFDAYKSLTDAISKSVAEQEQWQKEADYKQFLFDELTDAGFTDNEIEVAAQKVKQLSHTEQIKTGLQTVVFALEETDQSINHSLHQQVQQLDALLEIFPELSQFNERLQSCLIELKDIAAEISRLERSVDLNGEDLQILQERMDLGYRLLKKHQLQNTEELLKLRERLKQELKTHSNTEEKIQQLKAAFARKEAALRSVADELHEKRVRNAPGFVQEVNRLLTRIGMPDAGMKILCELKKAFDEFGRDDIAFLWDANNSGAFQPFQKTASGGELSRIMLCIKALTAQALALPTLIFDEVDTGISGEAARQVAKLLHRLSEQHQILCITHQPQIAAKGNTHFYVYKAKSGTQANTRIRRLEDKERIMVLAKMIGGDKPSEAVLKNAEELLATSTQL